MRKILTVLLVMVCPLTLAQSEPDSKGDTESRVSLPLSAYEQLRAANRPDSITVVDTLRLAGTFKERNLSVTFIGKSVGKHAATPVLKDVNGLSVSGCAGNALISRGDEGFRITSISDSFTVTCRIAAAGSDRLEIMATRDVLAVESSVVDGELIAVEKSEDGSSRYSLVRQSAGAGENLQPTATGHYLVTLLPDETRFRYAIDVHNPNRTRRFFEVRLRSGEYLQKVDADASYELSNGVCRFDLPPGDMTLVLTGQLSGDSFTPPVDASIQYLAIENHPIVRPVVTGTVKRISAAESGNPIQFRGPQAFILNKGETIHWKKTKLEALHTVSYAVSGVRHTFFIPAEGPVLGESLFGVDNQGASDVKLPLKPEPTYVSIQSEPLLMTRGEGGTLTIPLSSGKQDILVQDRQSLRRGLGFAGGRIVIPQLGVPATSLLVTINYPRQWYPIYQSFSTRTKLWRPPTEMLLVLLGLFLWTERVLSYLVVPMKQRFMISAAMAVAGTSFDSFAMLVVLADSIVTIAWLIRQLKAETWTVLKTVAATGVVLAGILIFVTNLETRKRLSYAYGSGGGGLASVAEPLPVTGEAKEMLEESAAQRNAVALGPPPAKPKTSVENSYQGLPARFEIPEGERHSYFGQEMLPTGREQGVSLLLISSSIVWFLGMIFLVAALATLWWSRGVIVDGVRQRFMPAESGEEVP